MSETILQICLSTSWGGLEMVALETAEMLKDRNIPCVTMAIPSSPLSERLQQKECNILPWNKSNFKNFETLRSLFKQRKIKTVLVQQLRDLFFIRIALLGIPDVKIVGISHTFVGISKKDLYHKWIYRRIDTLIVLTKTHQQNIIDHLAIDASKIVIIPNSVDIEKFNPKHRSESLRTSFGATTATVLIGLIGRLDKAKGQKILLEASFLLKKEFSNFKILLVGEETLNEPGILAELNSISESLSLKDQVIFTGYRSDIPALMASIDILVMSSDAETFGRVIIEGMASGATVVASRAGGVVDIIDDGKTGLLFTPGNPAELADRLLFLCRSNEKKKLLAINALGKTENLYQRSSNDKALIQILR